MLRLLMGPKHLQIAPAPRTSDTSAAVLALADRAAALLVELRDAMTDVMHELPGDSGPAAKLSRAELDALRALAACGSMRVGEMRRFVPGAQSTTSELVGRLERRGLARREVDPFDARATRVALRPRGQRLLDDRALGNTRACEDLLRALDADERERYVAALAVVVELTRKAAPKGSFEGGDDHPGDTR